VQPDDASALAFPDELDDAACGSADERAPNLVEVQAAAGAVDAQS
jgi:hypothetical protein